jgi:adenylate kinase
MSIQDIKPKAALIFGPPGSGKGTVSEKLKQIANLQHISTGDIFRGLSAKSDSGKLFYEYSNSGRLVPDEITLEIFGRYVEGLINTNVYNPDQKILLLDGIPRTAAQAELIKDYVEIVHIIQLDIADEQIIIDRILGRAKIEGRKDDADESIIRNRIEEYNTKTAAVLDCFPKEIVGKINGQQSPLRVLLDVLTDWAQFIEK